MCVCVCDNAFHPSSFSLVDVPSVWPLARIDDLGLEERQRQAEVARMATLKASMTTADLQRVVESTRELRCVVSKYLCIMFVTHKTPMSFEHGHNKTPLLSYHTIVLDV